MQDGFKWAIWLFRLEIKRFYFLPLLLSILFYSSNRKKWFKRIQPKIAPTEVNNKPNLELNRGIEFNVKCLLGLLDDKIIWQSNKILYELRI